MNKKIAVIPGDGIGTEVMEEGVKVLQHYLSLQGLPLAQLTHYRSNDARRWHVRT
jgi:isocitrate/isopropylmalate dehydrogenase